MRESIKNKNVIIALVIILTLMISTVAGVLIASIPRNGEGSSDNLALATSTMNIGNGVGDVDQGHTPQGTAISTADQLRNLLTSNGNGYLVNDIPDFTWGLSDNTIGSRVTFAGKLDGNGHTITIADGTGSVDSWKKANAINTSNSSQTLNSVATGLFVAVNKGTIENVIFKYGYSAGVVAETENEYRKPWACGIVAGENAGTMNNVKLVNEGQIKFHFKEAWGPANNQSNTGTQRIFLGGLCGVQSGTLSNAHVYMSANSILDGNSKASKGTIFGSSSSYNTFYYLCSVGGVIGLDYSNGKTSNLSVIGESGSTINSRCESTGGGTKDNSNNDRYVGAVVGYDGSKIRGVICDFKGEFNKGFNDKIGSQGNDTKRAGAMAFMGAPQGYYTTAQYAVNNSATIGDYDPMKAVQTNPNIGNSAGQDLGTSKSSFDLTNSLADINVAFTNTAAEMRVTSSLPKTQNNDIFWEAKVNNDVKVNYNSVDLNALNNIKNLDFTVNMYNKFDVSIITGKAYKSLATVDSRAYNGRDLIDEIKAQAFDGLTGIPGNFDIDQVNLEGDGAEVKELIYPKVYKEFKIISTLSEHYSYIDVKNRVTVGPTTYSNFGVTPADINNFNLPTDWQKELNINVAINNATADAIDRVEYRIAGGESSYTKVDGTSFVYKTNTPNAGVKLEIIGYKGDIQVTNAKVTETIKVDNIVPELNFDSNKLTENWLNYDVSVDFSADGGESGIKSVTVNGTNATNLQGGNYKYTFTENKEYVIVVTDNAGNTTELKVTAKIDKFNPTVGGVTYWTKEADGSESQYKGNTAVSKTVYARFDGLKFGVSGGYVEYFPTGKESEKQTVEYNNDGTFELPIIKTAKEGDTFTFVFYSNAVDEKGEHKSATKADTVVIIVGQETLTINIDDIVIDNIDKIYDGNDLFVGKVTFKGITDSKINNVKATGKYSQKNAGENLTLTIKLEATNGQNFAIIGEGCTEGNYEFADYNGKAPKITKKPVTVAVDNASRVYGDANPAFTANVDGLVADDQINVVCKTTADPRSNAGKYEITVDDSQVFDNYEITNVIKGELTITKRTITFEIENFKNSYADSEVPNIKGVFINPFGEKEYLHTTYYKDGNPVTFKEGEYQEKGRYTYTISPIGDQITNYTIEGGSSISNGFFNIVRDMIIVGEDFVVEDINPETNDVIEVYFTNGVIDFSKLIKYNDANIDGILEILYGTDENTSSNINEVGEYLVSVKLIGNEHYGDFIQEFTIKVVPTKVDVKIDPINKVFDNKATSITLDNATLSKLHALGVTDDQIKWTGDNSVTNVGTYKVALSVENPNIEPINLESTITITKAVVDVTIADVTQDYDPEKTVVLGLSDADKAKLSTLGVTDNQIVFNNNQFVDAGEYDVTLTIENPNIETIKKTIKVTIVPMVIPETPEFGNPFVVDQQPGEEELSIMYDGKHHFMLMLADHDQLIKDGYEVTYLIKNGDKLVEVPEKGILEPGDYHIVAKVSKKNYKDLFIDKFPLPDNPKEDETPKDSILSIAKGDFQMEVDLDMEKTGFMLHIPEVEYDGKIHKFDLTDEEKAYFTERGWNFSLASSCEFIDADSHSVVYKLTKTGEDADFWTSAVVETSVEIAPKVVEVKFAMDKEKYYSGDKVELKACFQDVFGETIWATVTVEKIVGESEEGYETEGVDLAKGLQHGKYLCIAESPNENYTINEAKANYVFEIIGKPDPVAVPVGVVSGVLAVVLIVGGAILIHKIRQPKITIQNIDLDD